MSKEILRQANEAYAIQNKDPKKLREFEEEIALWDVTLSEGLDDEIFINYECNVQ